MTHKIAEPALNTIHAPRYGLSLTLNPVTLDVDPVVVEWESFLEWLETLRVPEEFTGALLIALTSMCAEEGTNEEGDG